MKISKEEKNAFRNSNQNSVKDNVKSRLLKQKDPYDDFRFYRCPEASCDYRNNAKITFSNHFLEKHSKSIGNTSSNDGDEHTPSFEDCLTFECPECSDIFYEELSLISHAFGYHPSIPELHRKFLNVMRVKHPAYPLLKPGFSKGTRFNTKRRQDLEVPKQNNISVKTEPGLENGIYNSGTGGTKMNPIKYDRAAKFFEAMSTENEQHMDQELVRKGLNNILSGPKNFAFDSDTIKNEIKQEIKDENVDIFDIKLELDSGVHLVSKKAEDFDTIEIKQEIKNEDVDHFDSDFGKETPNFAILEPNIKIEESSSIESKFQCEICDRSFKSQTGLSIHSSLLHKDSNFYCSKCDIQIDGATTLEFHEQTVHENVKINPCHICGKSFISPAKREVHLKTVHNVKRAYKCDKCGKCFATKHYFSRHIEKVHSKLMKFKCDQCEKAFNIEKDYKIHMKAIHPSMDKNTKEYHHETARRGRLSCKFCGLLCYGLVYFKNHNLISHSLYACDFSKGPKNCHSTFEDFDGLKLHWETGHSFQGAQLKIQEYNYQLGLFSKFSMKCMVCDKTIQNHKSYLEHSKSHATQSRKDLENNQINRCEICSKQFVTLNGCKGHVDPNDFKLQSLLVPRCDLCALFFPNLYLLDNHMKNLHR